MYESESKDIQVEDFFFCYNPRLTNFLLKRGHRYITTAIHATTMKKFYMFINTERLSRDILSYKKSGRSNTTL